MARGRKDVYTGRSGQLAVLAELLQRECNAAIPEVDTGEDVFAFRDGSDVIARLQVKTANAKPLKTADGYTAQFSVPLAQLGRRDVPPLYYVFPVRFAGRWQDFLIVQRWQLSDLYEAGTLGIENAGALKLTLSFRTHDVRCGRVSLQAFRNAWDTLPPCSCLSTRPRLEARRNLKRPLSRKGLLHRRLGPLESHRTPPTPPPSVRPAGEAPVRRVCVTPLELVFSWATGTR